MDFISLHLTWVIFFAYDIDIGQYAYMGLLDPGHEMLVFTAYTTSIGFDEPAQLQSLTRVFSCLK